MSRAITLPSMIAEESFRDRILQRREEASIDIGRIWVQGNRARIATIAIQFPNPVTRARTLLGSEAEVIAFAGQREVARSNGTFVSLYADPTAASQIGWIDRIVIMGPIQVRIIEICIDAGDFGWKRYEQWKWSQGVQRSVESLYSIDPVLAPGDYELRVHTTTVVTGSQPNEIGETASSTFKVGAPPGFPIGPDAGVIPGTYPAGGPLTELSTYISGNMPDTGARLWYRSYDTAVKFNESYITRLYLQSGSELRVFVVNASQVPIRSDTRHIWSRSDASFDAWTELYIRTLNGDGTDRCASVDVDKVVRPEQVTAGSGEPLEPASLHACELRTSGMNPRVLYRFEFTTSEFVSFRHHMAYFEGRCRRLASDTSAVVLVLSPQERAVIRAAQLAKLAVAVTNARNALAALSGTVPTGIIDAAETTRVALEQVRKETLDFGIQDFKAIWSSCFGTMPPTKLSADVRISIISATTQSAGTDVLLLESPEPIVWERVTISAVRSRDIPLRKIITTMNTEFGRPDAGFETHFGGLRWLAGVELWVVEGALRARANEPFNVTILVEQASTIELAIRVETGGEATIATEPPIPGGPIVRGPSVSTITVTLNPSTESLIDSVNISGMGVTIESCSVTRPFIPIPPSGQIRIIDTILPTTNSLLDHEVTIIALENISTSGFIVRWIDALSPGDPQLYAAIAAQDLKVGQRVRLVPARASAPSIDDALVQAGGPGSSPPITGAIFQIVNSSGLVIHECASMPATKINSPGIVAFPNEDGTRAFLAPTPSDQAISPGHWILTLNLAGDVGPDLDKWSIASRPVAENVKLRFLIR